MSDLPPLSDAELTLLHDLADEERSVPLRVLMQRAVTEIRQYRLVDERVSSSIAAWLGTCCNQLAWLHGPSHVDIPVLRRVADDISAGRWRPSWMARR
jgi:hypothetical protein